MNLKKIFNDSVKERLEKYTPATLSVYGILGMLCLQYGMYSKCNQTTNYSYTVLAKAYKRHRRRAVSNNYLKMHHEPMRRRWRS